MHNRYLELDPWKIIEKGWQPENHERSESIFSVGNGKMGQRAMFEENYSGESLQGSYIAGVFYPDKTRVGWWKNGYPENFAKVLNSPNWIGIRVFANGEELDLAKAKKIEEFTRILDMKTGLLSRSFQVELNNGVQLTVDTKRFLSIAEDEIAAIEYSVTANHESIELRYSPYLNGDVYNTDANYDEKFWIPVDQHSNEEISSLSSKTKKTDFHVGFAMQSAVTGGELLDTAVINETEYVGKTYIISLPKGERSTLFKYVGVASSMYYDKSDVLNHAEQRAKEAKSKGFEALFTSHKEAWATIWENSDIQIEGDVSAQQGIRFNIFHLNQTYTGKDKRLNIGPKGFTGEKYGGSTYWDTEAYCLPFYLNTSEYDVARQLLEYRHNHLQKAIENAEKLGFSGGAALYPMVTMDGTESHNEWEITFEEIHRNGAIAYAIFNYVRHSGDQDYLVDKGLDVLIAISRFWAQRVNWSEEREKYVMLGVTGPNEYENNVNNNFYTNYIARWTLDYTLESINWAKENKSSEWENIAKKANYDEEKDGTFWIDIIEHMYFPHSEQLGIYLQQDLFLDKDILPADQLPNSMRPINQFWSWDRILRSCYIKQADTLQTFYFFEDDFNEQKLEKHFDFYEPITVHESSLSPCIHVVLAASLNRMEKAYDLYLRTSRLDLDDYNREVHEGLHITSMAGTWMSIVEGFGGLRVKDDQLFLNAKLPEQWTSYQFTILFRNRRLNITIDKQGCHVNRLAGEPLTISISGTKTKV